MSFNILAMKRNQVFDCLRFSLVVSHLLTALTALAILIFAAIEHSYYGTFYREVPSPSQEFRRTFALLLICSFCLLVHAALFFVSFILYPWHRLRTVRGMVLQVLERWGVPWEAADDSSGGSSDGEDDIESDADAHHHRHVTILNEPDSQMHTRGPEEDTPINNNNNNNNNDNNDNATVPATQAPRQLKEERVVTAQEVDDGPARHGEGDSNEGKEANGREGEEGDKSVPLLTSAARSSHPQMLPSAWAPTRAAPPQVEGNPLAPQGEEQRKTSGMAGETDATPTNAELMRSSEQTNMFSLPTARADLAPPTTTTGTQNSYPTSTNNNNNNNDNRVLSKGKSTPSQGTLSATAGISTEKLLLASADRFNSFNNTKTASGSNPNPLPSSGLAGHRRRERGEDDNVLLASPTELPFVLRADGDADCRANASKNSITTDAAFLLPPQPLPPLCTLLPLRSVHVQHAALPHRHHPHHQWRQPRRPASKGCSARGCCGRRQRTAAELLPLPLLIQPSTRHLFSIIYFLGSLVILLAVFFLGLFGSLGSSLALLSADGATANAEAWKYLFYMHYAYDTKGVFDPFVLPNNAALCTLQLRGRCSGGGSLCNEAQYATAAEAFAVFCPYCEVAASTTTEDGSSSTTTTTTQQQQIATFTQTCGSHYMVRRGYYILYVVACALSVALLLFNVSFGALLCGWDMVFAWDLARNRQQQAAFNDQMHYLMQGADTARPPPPLPFLVTAAAAAAAAVQQLRAPLPPCALTEGDLDPEEREAVAAMRNLFPPPRPDSSMVTAGTRGSTDRRRRSGAAGRSGSNRYAPPPVFLPGLGSAQEKENKKARAPQRPLHLLTQRFRNKLTGSTMYYIGNNPVHGDLQSQLQPSQEPEYSGSLEASSGGIGGSASQYYSATGHPHLTSTSVSILSTQMLDTRHMSPPYQNLK